MALTIGIVLALAVGIFATVVGFDRERTFYPVAMIVIAAYYVLFGLMGATAQTVVVESLVAVVFVAAAVAGFRGSLWIVAMALAGHGILDFFHASVISNPGVPSWWPPFCLAYDVVAAVYLAWLLKSGRVRAADPRGLRAAEGVTSL